MPRISPHQRQVRVKLGRWVNREVVGSDGVVGLAALRRASSANRSGINAGSSAGTHQIEAGKQFRRLQHSGRFTSRSTACSTGPTRFLAIRRPAPAA